MRTPVIAAFVTMSFIGVSYLAIACGGDAGPEIEAIQGTYPTDPAADAGPPAKSQVVQPKPKAKKDAGAPVVAPVDAGPVDAGVPAGDDDDDDRTNEMCGTDQKYMTGYLAAMTLGTAATCTEGGDECGSAECCFSLLGGLGAGGAGLGLPSIGSNYCLAK